MDELLATLVAQYATYLNRSGDDIEEETTRNLDDYLLTLKPWQVRSLLRTALRKIALIETGGDTDGP